MPKDFLGAEVEVGDIAVYVTTGRYTTRAIVEVLEVKKKVKVMKIRQDRKDGGIAEEFWADASSLFLVTEFKADKL